MFEWVLSPSCHVCRSSSTVLPRHLENCGNLCQGWEGWWLKFYFLTDTQPLSMSLVCLGHQHRTDGRDHCACCSLGPTMSPVCLSLGSPFCLVFLLSLPPSLFLLLRVLLKSFVLLKRSWLQFASAFCGKSKQRKIKKAQSGLDDHSGGVLIFQKLPSQRSGLKISSCHLLILSFWVSNLTCQRSPFLIVWGCCKDLIKRVVCANIRDHVHITNT